MEKSRKPIWEGCWVGYTGYIEQINKSMFSTVIKSQHGVGVSQIGPQVYKPSIKLPWTAQCAHACTRQNVFKM